MIIQITVQRFSELQCSRIWQEISKIERHPLWMIDAKEIRPTAPESVIGPGSEFDCLTQVGPFKTIDKLEISKWEEGRAIEAIHKGKVKGWGRLELLPVPNADHSCRCLVSWTEALDFELPRPLAAIVTVILQYVWKSNLARLEDLVLAGR
jgi:hypothetical protein